MMKCYHTVCLPIGITHDENPFHTDTLRRFPVFHFSVLYVVLPGNSLAIEDEKVAFGCKIKERSEMKLLK